MIDTYAGLKIRRAGDVQKRGFSWMLYGPGGCGKTTLAAMMHESEYAGRVGLFDCEGGSSAVEHLGDAIDVVDINNWKQIKTLGEAFKKDPDSSPWNTLIFDNLSEYQPLHMRTELHVADQPTQPEWGANTRGMVDFVTIWRDAARLYGINVFFCMWDASEKDDYSGILKHDLSLTPKLRETLPGKVDLVAYIEYIEGQPDYRLLSLKPSKKTVAKFRRPGHESARSVPYEIPYSLKQNPMVDLMAALRGTTPWPKDKYRIVKEEKAS